MSDDDERDRWWEDHDTLVALTSYLVSRNYTAHDVAYAVEKPWKFQDEYEEMLRQ